jgi:hypothetical protein
MKTPIILLHFLFACIPVFGQQIFSGADYIYKYQLSVGKTNVNPTNYIPTNPAAWLEIGKDSTNKAILLPRAIDTANILNPVKGLFLYQIKDSTLYYRNKSKWVKVADDNSGYVKISDSIVYYYPLNSNPKGYLSAETDPVANNKSITLTQLPGILVTPSATQLIGNNPSFSIEADYNSAFWNANKLQGIRINTNPPSTSQILQFNGSEWTPSTISTLGTVTSVGLSLPLDLYDISGSPITTSGTLTGSLKPQLANLVWASPNGISGAPSFRSLAYSDLPASGAVAGSYGSATSIPVVTVNDRGIITNIANTPINAITSLNGLTTSVQTFATGTTGTDFNISSTGSVHTFNMPSASSANRGAVTTGVQTLAGAKTFSSNLTLGSIPALGTPATTFLTTNGSGVVSSRTASQVLSDINAAPASGSDNYIRNQTPFTAEQNANFWVNGIGRVALLETWATTSNAQWYLNNNSASTTANRRWAFVLEGTESGTVTGSRLGFKPLDNSGIPGTETVSFLRNGNVGLGTIAPTRLIDINGTSIHRDRAEFIDTVSSTFGYFVDPSFAETPTKLYQTNGNGFLDFSAHSAANAWYGVRVYVPDNTGALRFATAPSTTTSSSFSDVVEISNTGNVGIGIAGGALKLSVLSDQGVTSGTQSIASFERVTGAPSRGIVLGYSSNGSAEVAGVVRTSNNGNLALNPDGGNVGIGKTNPGSLLDVGGTLSVDGNARFAGNGTPGAGKVPTGTDGVGNWTWAASNTELIATLDNIDILTANTYTLIPAVVGKRIIITYAVYEKRSSTGAGTQDYTPTAGTNASAYDNMLVTGSGATLNSASAVGSYTAFLAPGVTQSIDATPLVLKIVPSSPVLTTARIRVFVRYALLDL